MSVPGNQVIPQGQTTSGALADLFGQVNRPALNAAIATAQARNGLVSAQTQDAMIKAAQGQEQMEAWDALKTAYIAQGHKESDAEMLRAATVAATNHDPETALKVVNQGGLSSPTSTPQEQTLYQQGYEGKVAPLQAVSNNFAVPAGQAPPNIQQSPEGAAQTADTQSQTALRTAQTVKANTPATASSLSDDAAYNAAVMYNNFRVLPSLGMGASAANDRKKILDFAAFQSVNPNWHPPSWDNPAGTTPPPSPGPGPATAPPLGPGPATAAPPLGVAPPQHPTLATAMNVAGNSADARANTAALVDMTKRTANADSSEQTALKNLGIVREVLGTADQTGVPWANKIVNAVRTGAFGNPMVSRYQNALSTARTEYARVISMATGAAGITDAAMNEGQRLFPDDLAPEMFEANVGVAQREMANRTGSMHAQIANFKNTLHGISPAGSNDTGGGAGPAPVKIAGDADYAQLAPGTVYIGPDGVPRVK